MRGTRLRCPYRSCPRAMFGLVFMLTRCTPGSRILMGEAQDERRRAALRSRGESDSINLQRRIALFWSRDPEVTAVTPFSSRRSVGPDIAPQLWARRSASLWRRCPRKQQLATLLTLLLPERYTNIDREELDRGVLTLAEALRLRLVYFPGTEPGSSVESGDLMCCETLDDEGEQEGNRSGSCAEMDTRFYATEPPPQLSRRSSGVSSGPALSTASLGRSPLVRGDGGRLASSVPASHSFRSLDERGVPNLPRQPSQAPPPQQRSRGGSLPPHPGLVERQSVAAAAAIRTTMAGESRGTRLFPLSPAHATTARIRSPARQPSQPRSLEGSGGSSSSGPPPRESDDALEVPLLVGGPLPRPRRAVVAQPSPRAGLQAGGTLRGGCVLPGGGLVGSDAATTRPPMVPAAAPSTRGRAAGPSSQEAELGETAAMTMMTDADGRGGGLLPRWASTWRLQGLASRRS